METITGDWIPATITAIKDAAMWLAGFAPGPEWVFFCFVGLVALWIWRRKKK